MSFPEETVRHFQPGMIKKSAIDVLVFSVSIDQTTVLAKWDMKSTFTMSYKSTDNSLISSQG